MSNSNIFPFNTSKINTDTFNCDVLVKSVYNLTDLEFDTYCTLLKSSKKNLEGNGTVVAIQEKMGRKEKTMINRALKRLFELGLVTRQTESIRSSKDDISNSNGSGTPKRGYYYTYKSIPLDTLISELKIRLDQWYEMATSEIENIKVQFELKLNSEEESHILS